MGGNQGTNRRDNSQILTKLDDLSSRFAEFTTSQALMKQSQDATNVHLLTLNGKVVAHENRLNDQALINQKTVDALEKITTRLDGKDTAEKESGEIWKTFKSQIGWGAFVIVMLLFYKLLVVAGIVSDFLHKA